MKINKIDHIGIRVMNFDTSFEFYEKIGFKVTRKDTKENVFVIRHDSGVEINLIKNANNNNDRKNILMDVASKYPGYTHYAIEVESTADAKAYLESISVKITEGPVTFGDGKTSIFIRDPDLNVIELTQLPEA